MKTKKRSTTPALDASMKVPPKRKGNYTIVPKGWVFASGLNESPSEKEGKFWIAAYYGQPELSLNESPSEKEGKSMTKPH